MDVDASVSHKTKIGGRKWFRKQFTSTSTASVATIVTNQFEYHPCLNHTLQIEECRGFDIAVAAYRDMAIGRVFSESLLKDIVTSQQKTVAQKRKAL